MRRHLLLTSTVVATSLRLFAQQLMSDSDAMRQMKYDIQFLASDRLEGRSTASPGEKLAAQYIIGKFSNEGLLPYGDSATYLQAFTFATRVNTVSFADQLSG